MIVDTKYGEFEVKDITRKERRKFYKRVKEVFSSNDQNKLHDLGDEFTLLAFGDDKNADKALKSLSAVEEDKVLLSIISCYMGLDLGNLTGD
tara:strand:+ start:329 stop:604 length:276 start_codon:yes stop_codon:yes gene_type:complete